MTRLNSPALGIGLLLAVAAARAQEHVAPDPPAHMLPDMSHDEMMRVMGMDDRRAYHSVLLDRLEASRSNGTNLAWDGEAYYGGDYHKVAVKSEGSGTRGTIEDARVEAVWDRIVSRWWSTQVGIRHDWGDGPTRNWLAFGTHGLAPYFFDVEATAYLGENGRTALRVEAQYEVLLTQRLVLQPSAGINAYGKDDPQRRRMSGVSDIELGLRLRYEIRREVAPYVGVARERSLGRTADLLRATGRDAGEWQWVAGLRLNF